MLTRIFSIVPILLISLAGAACVSESGLEHHGLLGVEITLENRYLGEAYASSSAKVSVPATVRIQGRRYYARMEAAGALSIQWPKRNWDLEFESEGFSDFRQLRLAASASDPSMIKALLAFDLFAAAGTETPWREPASVYINGVYQGVYLALEKVQPDFIERRGRTPSRVYESRGNADFSPGMNGRFEEAWTSSPGSNNLEVIEKLLRLVWEESSERFEQEVFQIIHRESALQYMAGAVVTNHYDGFNKNLRLYSTREDPKLRFVPWDMDLTWVAEKTDLDPWRSVRNQLFVRIAAIPSFRAELTARVHSLKTGPADPAAARAKIQGYRDWIRAAYLADPYLRGRIQESGDYDRATESSAREIENWLNRL